MELTYGPKESERGPAERNETRGWRIPREFLDKLTDATIEAMFVDLVGLTTQFSRDAAEKSEASIEVKKQWLLRQ